MGGRWELDALAVQLRFLHLLGIERPGWTEADEAELAGYCNALMAASSQMTGGHREPGKKGTVPFDEIPTILNQIAVLACKRTLALGEGE